MLGQLFLGTTASHMIVPSHLHVALDQNHSKNGPHLYSEISKMTYEIDDSLYLYVSFMLNAFNIFIWYVYFCIPDSLGNHPC